MLTIFRPKTTEIGPQSTPEAADEAVALKKYARADSDVDTACCETWGVKFEDFEMHGVLPI